MNANRLSAAIAKLDSAYLAHAEKREAERREERARERREERAFQLFLGALRSGFEGERSAAHVFKLLDMFDAAARADREGNATS